MNGDSTTSGWYYAKAGAPAGQRVGPFAWEQLCSLAQAGAFSPADSVWNPQLSQWLPAAQVTGLFPATQPGAPAAYPPAAAQPGAPSAWSPLPPPYATGPSRSWLVPALITTIALLLVGGGLGAYFGLRGDGNDKTNPTVASGTTTTAATESTTTSAAATTTTAVPTTTTTTAPRPATWANLNPAGDLPSIRAYISMACDSASGKVILFGGYNVNTSLNDTWAYDPAANTWTNLNPAGSVPSPRAAPGMAYDATSRRVILFGGSAADWSRLNDTWAYDPAANTWTNLSPTGDVPPARENAGLVYDSATGKVILFGGRGSDTSLNDTWAYDPAANTWTNLNPAGDVPSPRAGHGMVYDSAGGKVILFGGEAGGSLPNDIWAYDAAANSWTNFNPAGELPSGRTGHAMAYDAGTGKVILFGGTDSTFYLGDTWAYGS